jgi:hypothetical protein
MSDSSLFDRVITSIEERKERVKSGLINSIPWPFTRFNEHVVGLEKGKIYQVTAGPKTGKSKVTNFMFIYSLYNYIIEHDINIKLVIKYFCLEESKESLITQFMSYVLFTKSKGKLIVSPVTLMSTKQELPKEVLDELKIHKEYIEGFLECVEYIEDVSHPFGIFKRLLDYAEEKGTQTKKTVDYGKGPIQVDDVYIADDKEEIVLTVVDHVSLLTPKKGENIMQAITELSGFLIKLRNKYGYSSLIVQQQSLAQTSMEGIRFNQGEPTIANLGDSKLTSRAVDISFGLYSPYINKVAEYEGYDIKFYKDNIRFLTVLQSRHGGAGVKTPLYFNGAINFFSELPKSGTPDEVKVHNNVTHIRNKEIK